MTSERRALEQRLREAGLTSAEARSVATRVLEANQPYAAWDALFNKGITRKVAEAVDKIFTLQTTDLRAQAFDRCVRDLLARTHTSINRDMARQNLEALEMGDDEINWALQQHGKLTSSKVKKLLNDKLKTGMGNKEATRDVLRTVCHANMLDGAMRGEAVQLGEPITAIILAIVSILSAIFAAVWAVVEYFIAKGDEEDFRRERKNLPLNAEEKIEFVEQAITTHMDNLESYTWAQAKPDILSYVRTYREGRRKFVGDEEESVRSIFNARRNEFLSLHQDVRVEELITDASEAARRAARGRAADRMAALEMAFGRLAPTESAITQRKIGKGLLYGGIALGVAGLGYVGYRILA